MPMLSRKDLNSAALETVKASRNPTTVFATNGEVQTNEEATVYVIEFIRDSKDSRRYTSSSLTWKTLRKSRISFEWTSGQKPQPTDEYTAARKTTYRSLSLVYRPVLPAQLHIHLQHTL